MKYIKSYKLFENNFAYLQRQGIKINENFFDWFGKSKLKDEVE